MFYSDYGVKYLVLQVGQILRGYLQLRYLWMRSSLRCLWRGASNTPLSALCRSAVNKMAWKLPYGNIHSGYISSSCFSSIYFTNKHIGNNAEQMVNKPWSRANAILWPKCYLKRVVLWTCDCQASDIISVLLFMGWNEVYARGDACTLYQWFFIFSPLINLFRIFL